MTGLSSPSTSAQAHLHGSCRVSWAARKEQIQAFLVFCLSHVCSYPIDQNKSHGQIRHQSGWALRINDQERPRGYREVNNLWLCLQSTLLVKHGLLNMHNWTLTGFIASALFARKHGQKLPQYSVSNRSEPWINSLIYKFNVDLNLLSVVCMQISAF